ncbi:MAG: hypothetical protein ACK4FG_00560 [Brevundimonas sp.]
MSKLTPNRPIISSVLAALGTLWWLTFLGFWGVGFSMSVDRERFSDLFSVVTIAVFGGFIGMVVLAAILERSTASYKLPGRGAPILNRLQLPSPWDPRTPSRGQTGRADVRLKALRALWYSSFGLLITVGPVWNVLGDRMPAFLGTDFRLVTIWLTVSALAIISLTSMRPPRATP